MTLATGEELLERARAGRIDQRHVAQNQNEGFRHRPDAIERIVQPVRDAEEKRSAQLEHLDALREAQASRVLVVIAFVVVEVALDERAAVLDRDRFGHPVHEQHRGEHDADRDRDR